MKDFRYKTLNGIAWSVVSQVGRQGLIFIIGIVLARLLSPTEFGLIAMVTVIVNFAIVFAELGFGSALIQKQDIREEHLSSVFWLNLVAGAALTFLFMAGAPIIAKFYGEPLLVSLTMLVSFNFFIGSLNVVQQALLTKALDFRTLSIVEIVAICISGIVAIFLAYTGLGVWSLAVQSIVLSSLTAVLLWKFSNWRPALIFKWNAVKELLRFSTSLLGTQTLNYWARNADYLLVGRFLGSGPLGIYNRAYSVMLFPLTNVSKVLARVMFPSLSIIQEDRSRVKQIYLKMTRMIALVTFPLMTGLFVTVQPFVLTVFGFKWIEMIPILQVLCLIGLIQSIITLNGNLYLSQGKADLQFKLSLIFKANIILGIIVGLRWGIMGVAVGYATASLVNVYPNFYFAGGLVNLRFSELLRNLSGVFACAVTMATVVWVLGLLLPDSWPYWGDLVVQVTIGGVVYSMLIHFFKVRAYREIRKLIAEQWLGRLVTV